MKSFTTPEYINPILEEIRRSYTPQYNKKSLAALDCVVLLQKRKGRDCIALRTPNKGAFYYYSDTVKSLFSEVRSYAEAAETYAGELDTWRFQEQQRIMEAVRAALLEEYTRTA